MININREKLFKQTAVTIFVFVMAMCFYLPTWSQTMPTVQPVLNEKLLEHAKETIRIYGDQIPADAQRAILEQKVTLGMSPYEAKLAAGAFFFKVIADPVIWPANSDPYIVIARQDTHPDNSKIWLTFETATQFPGEGLTRFTVFFEKGRVVTIEKTGSAK